MQFGMRSLIGLLGSEGSGFKQVQAGSSRFRSGFAKVLFSWVPGVGKVLGSERKVTTVMRSWKVGRDLQVLP